MVLGTSEAIRLSSIRSITTTPRGVSSKRKLIEWLAGLIDAKGSFLLSKKGYASLEIIMDLRDGHALNLIKQHYGGSIKLRSGVKAVRYRLHHKEGLLKLINDLKGHLRCPSRIAQLNKIGLKYNIPPIQLSPLNIYPRDHGWLSGFFDGEGTVTLNSANNQITISAVRRTEKILNDNILLVYKVGKISIDVDNSRYKTYKWSVSDREGL